MEEDGAATAAALWTERELKLDLELEHELGSEDEGTFGALVAANHKWLGHYARLHATFSVEHSLLERNSIWMNAFFQKSRMTTPPWSAQAKALIKKHKRTVLERLRCVPSLHSESEFSTQAVDPVAALMFAASVDRCPEMQLEYLLSEALDLFECRTLRTNANRSGFGGCVFRFLVQYTEDSKRLLVLLADDDADAVVRACQVAAQGQHWQPNMFIYTLQKRHSDNERVCALAAKLLASFAERMPITSPIQLGSPRAASRGLDSASRQESFVIRDSEAQRAELASLSAAQRKTHTLPALGSPKHAPGGARSPLRTPHSPTTTISHLYLETPSPYAPHMRLPITRPPTSPLEQSRRSRIFSTPKLAAVEGDAQRRCQTPNAKGIGRGGHFQLETLGADASAASDPQALRLRSLDPFAASPPKSPESGGSPKKRAAALSEKYSWNPECINSVSGFEWWWRSLPQNHASLEPTQKLKVVTKAAVRLHTKGDWQRAIELYLLSLSMEISDEVEFRLRINLACAYEAAQELAVSAEAFRAALALNPADPYARFKLGEVLGAVGDFAAARELFEAVADAYPQAADALKRLEQAEELKLQDDEERRAATAKAKLRRCSSGQSRQPQPAAEDAREQPDECAMRPAAPSTPAAPSSPVASRRAPWKAKTAKDRAAPAAVAPHASAGDGQSSLAARPGASVCSVAVMTEVSTTSVATTTDDESAPRCCLELCRLAERCAELDVDLPACLAQVDVHEQGLVRLESVADMWRILCGDDPCAPAGDALADELQRALAADCELDGEGQTLVRYQRILAAFEAARSSRQQGRSALAVEGELARARLRALLQRETHLLTHRRLAEASANEWVRAGFERVIAGDSRAPRETATSSAVSSSSSVLTASDPVGAGPRGTDVEQQAAVPEKERGGDDAAAASDGDGDEESSDTVAGISPLLRGAAPDGRPDGYTALSPRQDTKRERARRDQILLREKSRIFARKHLHCLRSLHDLALRARAHHAAQREAAEGLTLLARAARTSRSGSVGDSAGATSSAAVREAESASSATVREAEPAPSPNFKTRDEPLAHTTSPAAAAAQAATTREEHIVSASQALWSEVATSAARRVVLAGELRALRGLAQRFAAFSSASVGLPLLLASREAVLVHESSSGRAVEVGDGAAAEAAIDGTSSEVS